MLAASLALFLGLAEIVARATTPFPIHGSSNKVSHPRLGYVLDSGLKAIDERGFRNANVRLEEAEVVVVGDSHAYGNNVFSIDSFPSVLARKTKRAVYNMGMGSYGVYHYAVVLDELAAVAPEAVILAFYPANDLTLFESITELPSWGPSAAAAGITTPVSSGKARPPVDEGAEGGESSLKQFFTRRLALAGLLDHVTTGGLPPAREQFVFAPGLEVAAHRVKGHARATSLANDVVRLNYENSLVLFERARERLRAAGVAFGVLIVPTRELVFFEHGGRKAPTREFEALIANQLSLTRQYHEFFDGAGIPVVDALPQLVAALDANLESSEPFYPGADGHPAERGYEAYADAAVELLRKMERSSEVDR